MLPPRTSVSRKPSRDSETVQCKLWAFPQRPLLAVFWSPAMCQLTILANVPAVRLWLLGYSLLPLHFAMGAPSGQVTCWPSDSGLPCCESTSIFPSSLERFCAHFFPLRPVPQHLWESYRAHTARPRSSLTLSLPWQSEGAYRCQARRGGGRRLGWEAARELLRSALPFLSWPCSSSAIGTHCQMCQVGETPSLIRLPIPTIPAMKT